MASSDTSTGNGLPPERQQMAENSIAEYVTQYHQVAAQRDELMKENTGLKTRVAELKAMLEVAELAVSQMESKLDVAGSVRDEAVRRKAEIMAVLGAMLAIGRAFEIENEPLIRDKPDAEIAPSAPTGVAVVDGS